ncbi:Amyloid beta A4 protein-binding family A member 1, partial [Fasciolopsis buskii]
FSCLLFSICSVDYESDEDTDQLLDKPYQSDKPVYIPELKREADIQGNRNMGVKVTLSHFLHAQHINTTVFLEGKNDDLKTIEWEISVKHPDFPETLIHGVLFRASYLGSTQLLSQKQPTRNSRMYQAQEAVNRVKAPEGENQPSVNVALFVSTERIMLLNGNLQEILIDHELKTVSYIADIGEIFVLMARRPDPVTNPTSADALTKSQVQKDDPNDLQDGDPDGTRGTIPNSPTAGSKSDSQPVRLHSAQKASDSPAKLVCHVLESPEQDSRTYIPNFAYLNLASFANPFMNLFSGLLKARLIAQAVGHAFQLAYLDFLRKNGVEDLSSVKHLNYEEVLDQQEIFCDELTMFSDKDRHKQSCRSQTAVKLVVVDCPPVIEVLIRRPSLQYQLGFSVQDGIICSLLRGGIAERGGIRVDHRIIEINGQSVVAVSHEQIVHMLANAVGEIHIRTMPTSVYRLLTGQDTPNYI